MDFSVESLIQAVERQPELWDSRSELYKGRCTKRDGWTRVCCEVMEGFEEMAKADQLIIEKELITKWRTVRDGYVKAKKKQQENLRSGKAAKRAHPYVYGRLLKFLDQILHIKQSEDSWGTLENNQTDGIEQNIDIKVEGANNFTDQCPPPVPSENRRSKRQIDRDMANVDAQFDTFLNNSQAKISRVHSLQVPRECQGRKRKAGREKFYTSRNADVEEDEDLFFFKSLLSSVRKLNDSQKFEFRMNTMANLRAFFDHSDQPVHSSDVHLPGVHYNPWMNTQYPAVPPPQAMYSDPRPVSPSSEFETGSSRGSLRESPNYDTKQKHRGALSPQSSISDDAEETPIM